MLGGVKVVRDPARPEEEKNKFESAVAFPECRTIRAMRVRRRTTTKHHQTKKHTRQKHTHRRRAAVKKVRGGAFSSSASASFFSKKIIRTKTLNSSDTKNCIILEEEKRGTFDLFSLSFHTKKPNEISIRRRRL